MTANNIHTVDELLDVIQFTLHGFAADLCGSGPNEVFAAQGEVEHVRRLFAQQEAEIARLRGLLDAMGIQIAVMAAEYGDVRAEPDVMERVRAFCEPYRNAILSAARDGSELVGLNVPLRLAMPAAGGEE